jgi:hypothetical protein
VVLVGTGGLAGLTAVKTLDGLYTFPFFQTANVPGTTATWGDTLQSLIHAVGVTLASGYVIKKSRSAMVRKVASGAIAGAAFSVILDLARSWSNPPAFLHGALGGYPRMAAYPSRLGATSGSNLIGPGSLGSRAATVQAAHARYGSYPSMAHGASW